MHEEWRLLGCYAVWLLTPHKIPFFIVTAVKCNVMYGFNDKAYSK
jgi:hypothetical protein